MASEQGSLEKARMLYTEIITQEAPGSEAMGEVCNALGRLSLQQGQIEQAKTFFDEAATVFAAANMQIPAAKTRLGLASVRALEGHVDEAINILSNTITIARSLAAPTIECRSLRLQGLLYLELGASERAAQILADLSALAHAANLPREQAVAHVLRAQASLDSDTGRLPAAVAVNRLLGVFRTSEPLHGWLTYGRALLARASAVLGDTRTFKRSLQLVLKANYTDAPLDIRTSLQIAEAAHLGGHHELASLKLKQATQQSEKAGFTLLTSIAKRKRASWDRLKR